VPKSSLAEGCGRRWGAFQARSIHRAAVPNLAAGEPTPPPKVCAPVNQLSHGLLRQPSHDGGQRTGRKGKGLRAACGVRTEALWRPTCEAAEWSMARRACKRRHRADHHAHTRNMRQEAPGGNTYIRPPLPASPHPPPPHQTDVRPEYAPPTSLCSPARCCTSAWQPWESWAAVAGPHAQEAAAKPSVQAALRSGGCTPGVSGRPLARSAVGRSLALACIC
jgi:hypothetical protein